MMSLGRICFSLQVVPYFLWSFRGDRNTAAYRLKISPRADVHDVFHVSKQMVIQSKLFQLLLSPELIKDQPHIPMEV